MPIPNILHLERAPPFAIQAMLLRELSPTAQAGAVGLPTSQKAFVHLCQALAKVTGFRTAFTSLSWIAPQAGQIHLRLDRGKLSATKPQSLHHFLLAQIRLHPIIYAVATGASRHGGDRQVGYQHSLCLDIVCQHLTQVSGMNSNISDREKITRKSIQSLLEKIQDNEYRKTVGELVEAYDLDFIDTRRVIMLLESDPNMPNPAAVAMVQNIRGEPVGQALAKVEEAMDMLERFPPVSPYQGQAHCHGQGAGKKLTGTEQVVIQVVLDHLEEWIADLRQRIIACGV